MPSDDYKQSEPKLGQHIGTNPEERVDSGITAEKTTMSPVTAVAVPEPRAISQRKLEANRRNASKSGPRTLSGKKRASRNATKNGFFSKHLLVQHPDADESQADYDKLHASIHAHYQPVGFVEELLVEQIAVWYWRLRRVIRVESGQIARALDCQHQLPTSESTSEQYDHVGSATIVLPSTIDHLFVPGNGELDKMMRYEVMITRQLNHIVAELERLQRRRRGESVPAPIQVDISG
jgi:hypothetical protein